MEYDYGDILDMRNAPGIGHFVLVVGEHEGSDGTEIMYYMITSRVYAVFDSMLQYFNDCIQRQDLHFLRYFRKEKDKVSLQSHGRLSQAVFLDHQVNYAGCLETESMVVINRDPEILDKKALLNLKKDYQIVCRSKLAKIDALHLIQIIKHSKNISDSKRKVIFICFDKIKPNLK